MRNLKLAMLFLLTSVPVLCEASIAVFDPQGIVALAERNLIITAFALMLIVVIPVFILLFSFAWKYRAGNKHAKYAPDWQNNKALEAIWWAIPAVIILTLAVLTWKSSHELDPYRPIDSSVKQLTIQVVALDWKWLFIYPEQGIATVNFVAFPERTPINFVITADAPMNSFWIPQLGGQIYAMPGMKTQLHLMADADGEYEGVSANFSGPGFSGMKFVAKSVSQADFNNWVASMSVHSQVLDKETYNGLAKPSANNLPTYYAAVDANLYDSIVMKYMTPPELAIPSPSSIEIESNMPHN